MLDAMTQCRAALSLDSPLTAIKNGDVEDLRKMLSSSTYRETSDRTQLLTKAITEGKLDARGALVRVILENGANPNLWDSAFQKAPLHLAMERGLWEVVQVLLENKARPDARTSSSETGLHCAIRGLQDKRFSDESQAVKCMEILLKSCDSILNARDDIGEFTAVHLASKFKYWDIVKFLITQHKAHIDTTIAETSARRMIRDTSCDELAKLVNSRMVEPELQTDFTTQLYKALTKNKDDTEFLNLINQNMEHFKQIKDESYGKRTFLQIAATNGYINATEVLITVGADVNLTSMEETQTPAMLATLKEHSNILNALLKTRNCDLSACNDEYHKETILHIAVLNNKSTECLELLLQNAEACHLDIDAQDYKRYTALHYAARMSKTKMVDKLLKHNANIFIRDYENIPAFFEIDPKSINDMFDEQITSENFMTDDNYTIKFNYNLLKLIQNDRQDAIIPVQNTPSTEVEIPLQGNSTVSSFEPEMTPLEMLADSPEHRSLLNHPLIRSFLHLKWYRIYWFFYINFIFYFLFTASLSLHVYYLVTMNSCSNVTNVADETSNSNGVPFLRVLTAFLLLLLTIREIVQAVISPFRYINILENWIEICLILLTTVLLIEPTHRPFLQSIAAFAILLTFTELILLAGRHPSLSTYIKMFFKVLTSFVQLLLWYSILIIGFGFAFFIVFRNCEAQSFFYDLNTSLFKTFIMLTGEFESGDLAFNSLAITSHIIFILFLFFIAIVLLNLLNGLAVSDTQSIRSEAEVNCCVAQTRLYSELEAALLGGTTLNQMNFFKRFLGQYILIMPRLNSNEKEGSVLRVLLKEGNKMTPDIRGYTRDCTDAPRNCFLRCTCLRKACSWCLVFNTIVSDAKTLVEQKGRRSESQQVLEKMAELEKIVRNIAQIVGANH